jgi:hypothetical protein
MQMPLVAQTKMEIVLGTLIGSLPKWLSNDCHFATRQFYCSSWMIEPQLQTAAYMFANNNISIRQLSSAGINVSEILEDIFYLPSYPHQDICINYFDKCENYMKEFDISAYQPELCNIVDHDGVRGFPIGNQTVLRMELFLNITTNISTPISFATSPNRLLYATDVFGYEPQCPRGFVDPDNRLDPDNDMVSGTACATACRYVENVMITCAFRIVLI